MGNLLRVNFVSVFKNKLFWLSVICTALVSYLGMDIYYLKIKDDLLTQITTSYIIPVVIIASIVPFLVGSDFDGGIIRNKIMAGLSKGQIYFADLLVSCFCSVVVSVVALGSWLVTAMSVIGSDRFMRWIGDSNFSGTLVSVFVHMFFVVLTISFISTAITVIGENKAIAIVGILVVIMVGGIVSDATRRYATDTEKEIFGGFTDDFEPILEPNDYYVPDGTPKKYMYLVLDSTDIITQISYSPLDYVVADSPENYKIPVRYDVGLLCDGVLASVLALVVFKHKNIK